MTYMKFHQYYKVLVRFR